MAPRCVVVCCGMCCLLTGSSGGQVSSVFLRASMPATSFCCGQRCPGRCPWPQQAPSNRVFAPSVASLLDPMGLVPPKWSGRLRAPALAAANRACICPHLGSLAASCRVHAHRLVVAPRGVRVCACLLVATSRLCAWPRLVVSRCVRACGFVAASQACPCGFVAPLLAAEQVRVRPQLGVARAFVIAPLRCARPSAAAPCMVAR